MKKGRKLISIGALKNGKKGIDSLLIGLSNCTLACVFNKALWGVGVVAEGHKQRDAKNREIAPDRLIAKAKPEPQGREGNRWCENRLLYRQ